MENYINKINKKNLSFFIIVLFLFTISQQDLFKKPRFVNICFEKI